MGDNFYENVAKILIQRKLIPGKEDLLEYIENHAEEFVPSVILDSLQSGNRNWSGKGMSYAELFVNILTGPNYKGHLAEFLTNQFFSEGGPGLTILRKEISIMLGTMSPRQARNCVKSPRILSTGEKSVPVQDEKHISDEKIEQHWTEITGSAVQIPLLAPVSLSHTPVDSFGNPVPRNENILKEEGASLPSNHCSELPSITDPLILSFLEKNKSFFNYVQSHPVYPLLVNSSSFASWLLEKQHDFYNSSVSYSGASRMFAGESIKVTFHSSEIPKNVIIILEPTDSQSKMQEYPVIANPTVKENIYTATIHNIYSGNCRVLLSTTPSSKVEAIDVY